MIIKISKSTYWRVTEHYQEVEFNIPDSMKDASKDEILEYLGNSGDLIHAGWELRDDDWNADETEYFIDDPDLYEDEGKEEDGEEESDK